MLGSAWLYPCEPIRFKRLAKVKISRKLVARACPLGTSALLGSNVYIQSVPAPQENLRKDLRESQWHRSARNFVMI